MLTADDTPTIRFAILRRLDQEPGVKVCEVKFQQHHDCLSVGLLATLGDSIITRSRFDLPLHFEHSHLINEIDEIAEQYKVARRDFFTAGRAVSEEKTLDGTGLRGRWISYG